MYEYKCGGTVKDYIGDSANALVMANGEAVNIDYSPKCGDLVCVRFMPAEIGAFIVLGALSVATIYAGGDIICRATTGKTLYEYYKEKKAGQQVTQETLPTLRGSKNTSMKDKPIPLVLGSHYFSPYICGDPYVEVSGTDGETLYYKSVLCCGYNDILVDHIKMGNIEIASNRDSNGNIIADGKTVTAITKDSVHPLAQEDITYELISGNKDSTIYNEKVKDVTENTQLIKVAGSEENFVVERVSEMFPKKVELQFDIPALYQYDDNNALDDSSVQIKVEYSLDGETYNPLQITGAEYSNGINTITRHKAKEMRFVASLDTLSFDDWFEYDSQKGKYVSIHEENVVYFKIEKLTADSTSSKEENKVYLTNVRTWTYDYTESQKKQELVSQKIMDSKRLEMTTRLAVKIKATEKTEQYLDETSCKVHSVCPTYIGNGVWGNKKETNNPASIVKMLLGHEMLGTKKVPDSKIDLYALGELYNYCEKPYEDSDLKFECNGVVTSQLKLQELVNKVLATARTYPTTNGGYYSFFIDKRQNLPVCVLNNHNILNDDLSNTKEFGMDIHGVRVSFINQTIEYQQDTITAYRRGVNPDTDTNLNLVDITLDYVTDPILAWKFARFELAKLTLRPETWIRKVGVEGNVFGVGNLLTLQDDTLLVGIGNGGIVKSVLTDSDGNITGFTTDCKIDITDLTKSYGAKIQHVNELSGVSVATYEISFTQLGYFNSFTFKNSVSAGSIEVGDNVSFGELGKETTDVICLAKTRDTEGNFTCTFLPYSDDIFDYDDGEISDIPEFNSNVTTPSNDVYNAEPVERETVTKTDLNDVRDYVDDKVQEIAQEGTPIYDAIFNTPVIKKGNDGTYIPSVITASGKVRKGDTTSQDYSGTWHLYVDGEEKTAEQVVGANFSKNIDDLLENYGEFSVLKIIFNSASDELEIDEQEIPVLTGSAGYSVILNNPFQTYETDESGNINERTVSVKAEVYYGLKQLTYLADDGWEYGIIESDSAFDISLDVSTGVISIKALAGSSMADNGKIKIPVFIHSQTNKETTIGYTKTVSGVTQEFTIGYGTNSVGYLEADENGYFNVYFNYQKLTETSLRLNALNTKIEGYWNELTNDLMITVPEKDTLVRLFDSITAEYNAYKLSYSRQNAYSSYNNAYQTLSSAVSVVINYEGSYPFQSLAEKNAFNDKFENYYTAKVNLDKEIATVSVNFTNIRETTDIPTTTQKPNDYFVWLGDNNTLYGSTYLNKGMTYKWNGTNWVEDNDNAHVMATMNEALSELSQTDSDTIPAVVMAKRLIAMKVITDELYSKFASIEELEAGHISVGGYATTSQLGEVDTKAGNSFKSQTIYYQVSATQPTFSAGTITSWSTTKYTGTSSDTKYWFATLSEKVNGELTYGNVSEDKAYLESIRANSTVQSTLDKAVIYYKVGTSKPTFSASTISTWSTTKYTGTATNTKYWFATLYMKQDTSQNEYGTVSEDTEYLQTVVTQNAIKSNLKNTTIYYKVATTKPEFSASTITTWSKTKYTGTSTSTKYWFATLSSRQDDSKTTFGEVSEDKAYLEILLANETSSSALTTANSNVKTTAVYYKTTTTSTAPALNDSTFSSWSSTKYTDTTYNAGKYYWFATVNTDNNNKKSYGTVSQDVEFKTALKTKSDLADTQEEIKTKRQVFRSLTVDDTPTPPYSVGDLWIRIQTKQIKDVDETVKETVTGKVIYFATISRTSTESYNEDDWDIGDNLQDETLKNALLYGDTQIIGGYISTDLIEVDKLMSRELVINNGGLIRTDKLQGNFSYKANYVTANAQTVGNFFQKDNDYFVIVSSTECIRAYSEPKCVLSAYYPEPSYMVIQGNDFISHNGTTIEVPVGSCYSYTGRYSAPYYMINIGNGNWKDVNSFERVSGSFTLSNISNFIIKNLTSGVYIDSNGKIYAGNNSVFGGVVSAYGFETKISSGDYTLFDLGSKRHSAYGGTDIVTSRKFYCTGTVKTAISWEGSYTRETKYDYLTEIELVRIRDDVETVVYHKDITKPTTSSESGSEEFILDVIFGDEIKLTYKGEKMSQERSVIWEKSTPYVLFSISTRNEYLMTVNDLKKTKIIED